MTIDSNALLTRKKKEENFILLRINHNTKLKFMN